MFVFAVNELGSQVHIEDVPKSAKQLRCVYCQGKVMPKKGLKVVHHFAHFPGEGTTCRGASSTFQRLVFGFDFYDFELGAKEKRALKVLTEASMEHDGLMREFYWSTYSSACFLLANHRISTYSTSENIIKTLEHEGFFVVTGKKEMPNSSPRYTDIIRHTDKALAFTLHLERFDTFVDLVESEWEHYGNLLTDELERELFERYKSRLRASRLYLLRITPPAQGPAAVQTFYKIGITSRPIEQRLKEIEAYLVKQLGGKPHVEVLRDLDKAAPVETYFKKKYARRRFEQLEGQTEYFHFTDEELRGIQKNMHFLQLRTDAHRQRIREALAVKGKPPRGKESAEKFLEKASSREIMDHLAAGKGLRQIERETGYSINTIRKVNDLVNPKNAITA